ncbi:MAG: Zn-dependent protease with chaperone function [uncultured Campylobacterales bacterium]|uniref:Zn-dependent protease with chaperone function n=1 Tax=uncultured Campylobacterales bacterium TaxID=352960 RepID=A0A6S6SKB4_9BACT|nr:MAG: Zn-dependent protease with chaperone function [uncultured Campylobacterales bacterium]
MKIILSILIITFIVSCTKAPITGRNQFILIDTQKELALGAEASVQTITENKDKVDIDLQALAKVQAISSKIANVANKYVTKSGLPDFKWEFHVISDDKTINAFCLPGGKIFVYTGIMNIAKNDAQLATVIAHEVAHAIARHSAERMTTQMGVNLVSQIGLASLSGNVSSGNLQLINTAFGIGSGLGVLKHSRSQESESDHIGIMIMAEAGYDPRESISFWQNMKEATSSKGAEFLSTHPLPETRINDLKKLSVQAYKIYKANI